LGFIYGVFTSENELKKFQKKIWFLEIKVLIFAAAKTTRVVYQRQD